MKKYFLFAAVAGMLASCSSDSLTAGSDSKIEQQTQDDRVAIEIGVATTQQKGMTRGTATTGGTGVAGDENIWRGERINVMMYQITNDLPTFNPTLGGATGTDELYNNTSMVTPLADENTNSGIAKEPSNATQIGYNNPQYTYVVKYYPSTGQSDFWGYYLGGYGYTIPTYNAVAASTTLTQYNTYYTDNAGGGEFVSDGTEVADGTNYFELDPAVPAYNAAGNGTLTMYANATLDDTPEPAEADAKYVATNFVIDGTHDLLVGKATSDNPNAYSAKAARAGVQPDITFKHLLSRLQFKVKPGLASADGIKVTAIKVRSKKTGKMIVAYKYKNAEGPVAEPTRIVWTDEASTAYDALPQLTLKQRNAGTGLMEGLRPVTLDWNGGSPVSSPVGEALIVAPQEKYQIEVDYQIDAQTAREWYAGYTAVPNGITLTLGKTYYTDNTGGGAFVSDGTELATGTNYFEFKYDEGALTVGGTTYKAKLITDLERTTTSGTPAAPVAFAEGDSYLVTITLYGPEEIKITTTLTAWNTSDQDIEIGQD